MPAKRKDRVRAGPALSLAAAPTSTYTPAPIVAPTPVKEWCSKGSAFSSLVDGALVSEEDVVTGALMGNAVNVELRKEGQSVRHTPALRVLRTPASWAMEMEVL